MIVGIQPVTNFPGVCFVLGRIVLTERHSAKWKAFLGGGWIAKCAICQECPGCSFTNRTRLSAGRYLYIAYPLLKSDASVSGFCSFLCGRFLKVSSHDWNLKGLDPPHPSRLQGVYNFLSVSAGYLPLVQERLCSATPGRGR